MVLCLAVPVLPLDNIDIADHVQPHGGRNMTVIDGPKARPAEECHLVLVLLVEAQQFLFDKVAGPAAVVMPVYRAKKERHFRASEERHPKASLFFVSFLCAFPKLFPSLSTSTQQPPWAFSRFATVLVRRATEPYYALDCSVRGAALVKLVHRSIGVAEAGRFVLASAPRRVDSC